MTQTEQSDESLYAAYCSGDMAAFDSLYARYRRPLYLFLLRRGHTESTAEDIFHDCWIKVIDYRQKFDGNNFRAWVYSVARNLSIDIFRRDALRSTSALDDNSHSNAHFSTQKIQEDVDCIELIKSSVAVLPVEQRDVFLLQQEGGLSLQQIADLMAVGRETIKSRLRYAMNQLRVLMEECL